MLIVARVADASKRRGGKGEKSARVKREKDPVFLFPIALSLFPSSFDTCHAG